MVISELALFDTELYNNGDRSYYCNKVVSSRIFQLNN